jgi:dienelactone hydrolase
LATPIAFEGCFGWLHPGGTSRGVVLCGPVGEEADYVYANLRRFADRLASAGHSTLRFDYPGLYNSLDLDEGRDPPAAWIESIKAASRWLKAESGVEDVVLVGLRFGSGLALRCAEELGGVDRLVLMAPVVSGVAYQRELALLAKLGEGAKPVSGFDAPHQAATLFTAEQTFDVKSLRCLEGDVRPARRVLILSDAGSGGVRKLGERLRALGCEVTDRPFERYAELMVQPEWAQYPEEAFGGVIDWLRDEAPVNPASSVAQAQRLTGEATLNPPGARESAVFLGEDSALFGVLCRPDVPRDDQPGVLFLNTGAVPQAGMNRMWVSLARKLATLGLLSLRFDISGVGDSPRSAASVAGPPNMLEACADVGAAIAWLQAQGCSSVTLIGFCWGAQLACNVALEDSRVARLIMINSRRQFWDIEIDGEPRRSFSTYLRLSRDGAKWGSLWRGEIPLAQLADFAGRLAFGAMKTTYEWAAAKEGQRRRSTRKLRSLHDRGVETLFVQGNDDTFLAEFEDYFGVKRNGLGALLNINTHFFHDVHHRFPNDKRLAELIRLISAHLVRAVSA